MKKMLTLDTKYVLFALIFVLIISAIYFNTRLTNVEETTKKHDQFTLHIGEAFKPLHQKYAEHDSRINNVDEAVKNIRSRLSSIVLPSMGQQPKRRMNDDEEDDEDLLQKMKSTKIN